MFKFTGWENAVFQDKKFIFQPCVNDQILLTNT